MSYLNFSVPFYAVYALMFAGLAWTTRPFFVTPAVRQLRWLWLAATLLMAAACVGLALLPWLGRAVLGFSSIAIMAAAAMTFLLLRAWRTALTPRIWRTIVWGLVFNAVVFNILLHVASIQWRVGFLLVPSALVMLWGIREGWLLGRLWPSAQQKFLVVTQVVLLLVVVVWLSSNVFLQVPERLAITNEPAVVAVGRLLVVSLMMLMMVNVVGVALERMHREQAQLRNDMAQADDLQRKMAWTLQERNQMLKSLIFSPRARNADALISHLSHEINQPIGAIRLYADQLMNEADASTAARDEILRKVVHCTDRVQQSVNDFRLFFSSAQNEHREVQLDVLTRDILEAFAGELDTLGIEVSLEAAQDLRVRVDVTQIKMVILNLLTNAMDALRTHEGPRRLQLRLWSASEFVNFAMQDTGPGVAPEIRDKLFTSFFTTKELGVGLGLWLCRAIVEFHGGAMSAQLQGPGACFEFNLPRSFAHESHNGFRHA